MDSILFCSYTWHVPIWYQSQFHEDTKFTWLKANETGTVANLLIRIIESIHIFYSIIIIIIVLFIEKLSSVAGNTEWLLINPEVRGYYRVNYDRQNWELLADQLQKNYLVIIIIISAAWIKKSYSSNM